MELWLEVYTQWRERGGLDYNVVYQEAARLGIDLSPCVMKKIKMLERKEIKQRHDAESNH